MNLADERLKQLDDPTLTPEKRALLRCQIAAELIHTGKYEAAREVLGDLWQGIGKRPDLKGLTTSIAADVLLQCGVLTGYLGSVRSIADAQERAKDLLTEALRKFESQGQHTKVSEVRYELGLCYYRLGAYDEARIVLDEAAKGLDDADTQLKAKILIRHSFVEIWTGRHHDALRVLEEAQPFFEGCGDAIKGRWHGQMGVVFLRLAAAEGRTDYADRAIMEFTAAAFHFELANHEGYCARALNNLAFLLYKLGRHAEAHENLDRAAAIFASLHDESSIAQANETRARVLVAEQRYEEAARVISEVIPVFEKGGEYALLADALTIQGVVLARLKDYDRSVIILRRAMNTAHDSGALSNASLAALALIEEHGDTRLSESDLYTTYRRADEWLKETQDAEEIARLRACARIVTRRLHAPHAKLSDEVFSLPDAVLAYEERFIEQALELEGGVLTRAAKRLGISRQWLSYLLDTRHRNLRHKRKYPGRSAGRSPAAVREPRKSGRFAASQKAQPLSILVVEDHPVVADAMRDTFEIEGWRVRVCSNASAGRGEIEGDAHFDLLVLDHQLDGGMSGVELIRLARSLESRRRTPIVMFSASNVEGEARAAGADAFLRKPDDVGRLAATVKRLLAVSE
jgi:CheY-like chemotaxis protein